MNETRRNILKTASAAIAIASIAPLSKAMSEPYTVNSLDKLQNDKGEFVLPPLSYAFDSLEPFMDAETLMLHHDFHHGAAVNGLNKDFAKIKEYLDKKDMETIDYWVKKSSYHGSSHILHSIFWTNLAKNNGSEPKGTLLKYIEKQYGTYQNFKSLLSFVANNVDGSGWGITAYQPMTDQLIVLQCENHDKLIQWGAIPILIIDVWEHAYYLKYRNRRSEFVSSLFNIINWDNVSMRLDFALKSR